MTGGEHWKPCPDGLIGGMVRRQRWQRRRQAVERAAIPVAVIALACIFYLTTAGGSGEQGIRMISCTEAMSHFAALRSENLDATTKASVERHLENCPHCRRKYQQDGLQDASDRQPLPSLIAMAGSWNHER